MPTDQEILELFEGKLSEMNPDGISRPPSSEIYEDLIKSLLDSGMTLQGAKEWGEAYPMYESDEVDILIDTADLFRLVGLAELIGSEQQQELEDEAVELIQDHCPPQTVSVEDVLSNFGINSQEDLDRERGKREPRK